MLSKNKSWRKRILVVIGLLVLISPCAFCWWFLIGNEIVFRARLPIYSGAQEVDHTRGVYGANVAVQSVYFWTADPLEKVRHYFETFTLPFIDDPYPPDNRTIKSYRSVYSPSGALLPIITDDITHETADAAHDYECHYQMNLYECVTVIVQDYGKTEPLTLPPPSDHAPDLSPQPPLSLDPQGGTLIIFTYFVNDM